MVPIELGYHRTNGEESITAVHGAGAASTERAKDCA
jgi:hypothetical protein